jgi:hypothetical protein
MDFPINMEVDHIDRNPLNNSKNNLRVCTKDENNRNTVRARFNGIKYKGVTFAYQDKKDSYKSYIYHNGMHYNLGLYATQEEAAMAYNQKAKELFGEFAYQNKITI